MAKEKQVQIPQSLFMDICRYFLLDQPSPVLAKSISDGLSDKFKAINERNAYTKSLSAETAEEREQARQNYIDSKYRKR